MVENVGVLLAAGTGSRFATKIPKQYTYVDGEKLISYGIEAFRQSLRTDAFIVVVGETEFSSQELSKEYGITLIQGGDSRAESFQNALDYIAQNFPDCQKVLFHEAARPLVSPDVFDHYFELLEEYDYIESCKRITDSLGSYLPEIPNREDYFLIQAPEAYRFPLLREHFDVHSDIYYAAHQLPESAKGYQYFDIPVNIKVTYPKDLELIEYYLTKER